jgi:hypothetical protein
MRRLRVRPVPPVPIDVELGEGQSTDEMCLEIFGIAADAPPQPTARSTPMASDLPPLDVVARMLR